MLLSASPEGFLLKEEGAQRRGDEIQTWLRLPTPAR